MLSGLTVLVVEREYLIALEIQRLVEQFGGQAEVLSGPRAALLTAQPAHGFALIVLEADDLTGNRLDVVRAIAGTEIPLILCTSDASQREGHDLFPATPVLVKPFADQDFAEACRGALKARPHENS